MGAMGREQNDEWNQQDQPDQVRRAFDHAVGHGAGAECLRTRIYTATGSGRPIKGFLGPPLSQPFMEVLSACYRFQHSSLLAVAPSTSRAPACVSV